MLLLLDEQISLMFYYIQDVYQKNQLGTRLKIDIIPGLNIITRKPAIANINGAGGSGAFRGQSSQRTFLGTKEHLDWLKIDLNEAIIFTVQDHKHTKN